MNQLKAGVILSYVCIFLNIIIGLIYTPFMLRCLGQSEYGMYSLATSVIGYLTVLDLGFGNAIIRYTAKFKVENKLKEQSEMFGMFLKLYYVIGVIALFIGALLLINVNNLFDNSMDEAELSTMRTLMALMSFNLAFTFPLSIFGSIISAHENFVFQKFINIIRIVLNPLIMTCFLFFGYKSITMVVLTTVFNLSTLLINYWYCIKKLHIKITFGKFNWSFLKEISIYSFWIFLNAIMDRIYWSTGQFILGVYQGAISVAIYSVAIQLKDMFYMFSTAISGVFLPKVTAMVSKENSRREISNLFIKTGRLQYAIMIFILLGFVILGKEFVTLWAGDNYVEAYTIALIVMIPSIVPLIQNIGITILQARNQMKFRSLLYLFISVGSVFFAIPLSKIWGALGCAIATSSALIIGQVIIMNIYYEQKQHLNIIKFWKEIFKMSLIPTLFLCLYLFVRQYIVIDNLGTLFLCIATFSILYIPLFWKFGLNGYERELIGSPVKKIIKRFI